MTRENKTVALGILLVYILTLRLAVILSRRAGLALQEETAALQARLRHQVDSHAFLAATDWPVEMLLQEKTPGALLPVVEKKADELRLSGRLKTVIPVTRDLGGGFRASGFDLRLESLNLEESVLFLETLEAEAGFYLDRATMEKSRAGDDLSLRVRILAPSYAPLE
jgi:hypothetical protein